jgi:hypothetical protein
MTREFSASQHEVACAGRGSNAPLCHPSDAASHETRNANAGIRFLQFVQRMLHVLRGIAAVCALCISRKSFDYWALRRNKC